MITTGLGTDEDKHQWRRPASLSLMHQWRRPASLSLMPPPDEDKHQWRCPASLSLMLASCMRVLRTHLTWKQFISSSPWEAYDLCTVLAPGSSSSETGLHPPGSLLTSSFPYLFLKPGKSSPQPDSKVVYWGFMETFAVVIFCFCSEIKSMQNKEDAANQQANIFGML